MPEKRKIVFSYLSI